jgi:hypothetical protein
VPNMLLQDGQVLLNWDPRCREKKFAEKCKQAQSREDRLVLLRMSAV